jgi:hypothetical protein
MSNVFKAVNKEQKKWDDIVYLAHRNIQSGEYTTADVVIMETDKYIRKLERHRQEHKVAKLLQRKVNNEK